MAGNIKINSAQLGDSATATNNFVLTTNLDGTAKLARGNVGATTQDILTVSAGGVVTLLAPPVVPAQSMVRLNTANGYGSTNTKIRRFTNVVTNQGSDITYADSATLGASFTINTNGVYSISYSDQSSTAMVTGLSINTTQPTVSIASLAITEILGLVSNPSTTANGLSTTAYLPSGSVIRPHTDGSAASGSLQFFTITRVA